MCVCVCVCVCVCGVVWCGVVCGVWCGVVWCGVVWCGVVWCVCVFNGLSVCTVNGCPSLGYPEYEYTRTETHDELRVDAAVQRLVDRGRGITGSASLVLFDTLGAQVTTWSGAAVRRVLPVAGHSHLKRDPHR